MNSESNGPVNNCKLFVKLNANETRSFKQLATLSGAQQFTAKQHFGSLRQSSDKFLHKLFTASVGIHDFDHLLTGLVAVVSSLVILLKLQFKP
jgi:hypothetical protein